MPKALEVRFALCRRGEGMSALRRMQVVPAEMERVSVRPTRSVHVLQSVRSTEPRLHAPPTQWQMPKNSASPLTK